MLMSLKLVSNKITNTEKALDILFLFNNKVNNFLKNTK